MGVMSVGMMLGGGATDCACAGWAHKLARLSARTDKNRKESFIGDTFAGFTNATWGFLVVPKDRLY